MPRYYIWDKIIPKADCKLIVDECNQGLTENAKYGNDLSNDAFRKTNIHWVASDKLITKLIYGFIHEANDAFFKYDISDHEQIQFGKYEVGGHVDYHQDSLILPDAKPDSLMRKLSASVLLSDSEDFEGGEFLIYNGVTEPIKPLKGQGSVVIFDSRDYHKVEPVTLGVRYSLVMWAMGPLFK